MVSKYKKYITKELLDYIKSREVTDSCSQMCSDCPLYNNNTRGLKKFIPSEIEEEVEEVCLKHEVDTSVDDNCCFVCFAFIILLSGNNLESFIKEFNRDSYDVVYCDVPHRVWNTLRKSILNQVKQKTKFNIS